MDAAGTFALVVSLQSTLFYLTAYPPSRARVLYAQVGIGESLVQRINISTGTLSTLAGTGGRSYADGKGTDASFNMPCGVAVDAAGAVALGSELILFPAAGAPEPSLFFSQADYKNHAVRRINVSTAVVVTLVGLAGNPGAQMGWVPQRG